MQIKICIVPAKLSGVNLILRQRFFGREGRAPGERRQISMRTTTMDTIPNLPAIIPLSAQQNFTIFTPTRDDLVRNYVHDFRAHSSKSAESTIKMALTLLDAEKDLNDEEFKTFCSETGIGPETLKKYRGIGRIAPELLDYLHCLPHCWTTLYWLSTLDKPELDHLLTNGILTPGVSRKRLEEYLCKLFPRSKPEKTPNDSAPSAKARSIPAEQKRESSVTITELGPADMRARLHGEICSLLNAYESLRETNEDIYGMMFELKRALQPEDAEDEDEEPFTDNPAAYPAIAKPSNRSQH